MKSTHPFYPILIPNTSFVKKFHFVVFKSKNISTRVCKKIILIRAKKLFGTGCPKNAERGGKTNFFFHRGFRKKY